MDMNKAVINNQTSCRFQETSRWNLMTVIWAGEAIRGYKPVLPQ